MDTSVVTEGLSGSGRPSNKSILTLKHGMIDDVRKDGVVQNFLAISDDKVDASQETCMCKLQLKAIKQLAEDLLPFLGWSKDRAPHCAAARAHLMTFPYQLPQVVTRSRSRGGGTVEVEFGTHMFAARMLFQGCSK